MIKKNFKKIAIAVMLFSGIGLTNVNAQESNGLFNHLSLSAGVGSYGLDFEAAAPIGKMFSIRAGVGYLPDFSIKSNVNATVNSGTLAGGNYNVDVKGKLGRVQGKVLVNFYPIPKLGLFVAAGAYFGGDKLIEITGHSEELKQAMTSAGSAGIIIGDKEIPVDNEGNVAGGLKVKQFRPYVGIGYGKAVPKSRVSFMVEAGVQFHGTPELYTSEGEVKIPEDGTNSDDKFTKIVDKLKVYPVINFKINTRIL